MSDRLLLVKPPYASIPVGFAYVMASLDQHGIGFDFVDLALQGPRHRRLLRQNEYVAVATGGLVGEYEFFMGLIEEVRALAPGTPVILGGNVTKDLRRDFLFDKIGADYGILGEAETALPFLLQRLSRGERDLAGLRGVVYRSPDGSIVAERPERLDLCSHSLLPAWQHIDVEFYSRNTVMPFWGARSAMPVLSGRGCVGHCAFCSPTIGTYRKRPIAHVIEEIELVSSRYEFDWLLFWNEMLYDSPEDIQAFCDAYRRLPTRKPWVCSLRADVELDPEILLAMRDAGCVSLSVGIESGSNKVLRAMCKATTREQTVAFFRQTREVGLPCTGTFMIAHEGEGEAELAETIDMVTSEEMTCAESLTNAYPGTQLHARAVRRGLIADEWQFLTTLKFACGLWDHKWTDRRYLNLSNIPSERLWDVLVRESRRFHTFLLNRFRAGNPLCRMRFGSIPVAVEGTCAECGAPASLSFPPTILAPEGNCPACFRNVVFDVWASPPFRGHFEELVARLGEARRIVVLGVDQEASGFLRTDVFGLDYDKVLGFLDLTAPGGGGRFINMPRLAVTDLARLSPDLVLVVDEMRGQAEPALRLACARAGVPVPPVAHLWPSRTKRSLRLTAAFNALRSERLPRPLHTAALRGLMLALRGLAAVRSALVTWLLVADRLRASGVRVTAGRLVRRARAAW